MSGIIKSRLLLQIPCGDTVEAEVHDPDSTDPTVHPRVTEADGDSAWAVLDGPRLRVFVDFLKRYGTP